MKINILLPHKEKFDKYKASSVSITVFNNYKYSKFKHNIMVYGQDTINPLLPNNFTGIKDPILFFRSKNTNLAKKMCNIILSEGDKDQIIEIHNRPYLINLVRKCTKVYPIFLFFHNDPQTMYGSKTILQRQKLLKKVTNIFCVSSYIKKKFLEGLDDDHSKVHVIYNGVERKTKKPPKKIKEIIFSGRFVPEKGVHLYVNAVSGIAKHFPDWKFRLIGSTYLGSNSNQSKYALQNIKNFNKIGKQAIFDGFLSSNILQRRMKSASIIIIPSLWNEPFGLVVAEAMSNGVAIITSNVGGIPEIINNNGIVLDNIDQNKIEDTILKLLRKPSKIKKLQNLSWDNFKHTSEESSKKLDDFRKKILVKKQIIL